MANNTIEIVIKARNETGKAFAEIGKGISDLGDFGVGVLKTGLKVGFAAAAAGATALGGALAYAVSEAADAQANLAQLDAVLKSTGGVAGVTADMATDLADSLSQVTRFSDDAILSGENMLLTFTNIGKDIFPQATETILDMSQALGQDLKSSAIQLGKALNDPILGVSALARVGVNFSEEQKEMVKAMVEAGDVAEAQAFILHELQLEFGGSARAAGQTFAGQLDILKNSLANVAEEIGMELLPYLTKFITGITANLVPAIKTFGEYISFVIKEGDYLNDSLVDLPKSFRGIAKAIGRVLAFFQELLFDGRGLRHALENLIPREVIDKIYGFGDAIRNVLDNVIFPFLREHKDEIIGAFKAIGIAIGGATIIKLIGNFASAILGLSSPVGWIIAAAGLIGAAWEGNWFGIQEKVQAVIDYIKPLIEEFVSKVQQWFFENKDAIYFAISEAWGFVRDKIIEVIDFIGPIVSDFLREVAQWWAENGDSIIAIVVEKWEAIKSFVSSTYEAIKQFSADFQTAFQAWLMEHETSLSSLSTAWEEAKTSLSNTFESIKSAFSEVGNAISENYPEIEEALSGFSESFSDLQPVLEFLSWAISELFIAALKTMADQLKITADVVTFVFDLIGRSIDVVIEKMTDFFGEIERIFGGAADVASGMWDGLTAIATKDTDKLGDVGKKISGGWTDIFMGALDAIGTSLAGPRDIIIEIFKNMFDLITGGAEDMSSELVGNSIIPDMMTAIQGVFTSSTQAIQSIFGTFSSESIRAWDTMMNGILSSVTGNSSKIISAIKSLVEQIKSLFIAQDWQGVGMLIGEQIAAGIQASADAIAASVASTAAAATPATGTQPPAPTAEQPAATAPAPEGANQAQGAGGGTSGATVMNINIGDERIGSFVLDKVNQAVAIG